MRSRDRQHDTVVRYLLGELSERECDQLEQSYFSREGGFDTLLAIEEELVDSYVAGELSPEQRRRFESRYPAREHGDGIQFAKALKEALREQPPGAQAEPAVQAEPVVPPRRPSRLWLGLAAVLLLVAAGLVLRGWLQRGSLPNGGAERAGTESPRPPDRPSVQPSPSPALPLPGIAPWERVVAVLYPGQERDGPRMPKIVVPPEKKQLLLTLVLEQSGAASYSAQVQTASEEEVYHLDSLSARSRRDGFVVDLAVPAGRLAARDYVVQLTGHHAGGVDVQSAYTFRVIRPE
jgi:hypothetical protein